MVTSWLGVAEAVAAGESFEFAAEPGLDDEDAAGVPGAVPPSAAMNVARSANSFDSAVVAVVAGLGTEAAAAVEAAAVEAGVARVGVPEAGEGGVGAAVAAPGVAGAGAVVNAGVAGEGAVKADGGVEGGVGVAAITIGVVGVGVGVFAVLTAAVVTAGLLEVAVVEAVVPEPPVALVVEEAGCNCAMNACRSVTRVDASALSEAAEAAVPSVEPAVTGGGPGGGGGVAAAGPAVFGDAAGGDPFGPPELSSC